MGAQVEVEATRVTLSRRTTGGGYRRRVVVLQVQPFPAIGDAIRVPGDIYDWRVSRIEKTVVVGRIAAGGGM